LRKSPELLKLLESPELLKLLESPKRIFNTSIFIFSYLTRMGI
jgi:hypothetical protein